MTRRGLAVVLLVAAGNVAIAASAPTPDAIPRFSAQQFNVAPGVVLAGTPDLDALQELSPSTTVVVDLRTAAEGTADESRALRSHGFEYHNIPVTGATIDSAQLERLGAIADAGADSATTTLVVHCRSANRAAMLWGAYLLEQGHSLDEAVSIVGPALTGQATRAALLNFAAEQQAAQDR